MQMNVSLRTLLRTLCLVYDYHRCLIGFLKERTDTFRVIF